MAQIVKKCWEKKMKKKYLPTEKTENKRSTNKIDTEMWTVNCISTSCKVNKKLFVVYIIRRVNAIKAVEHGLGLLEVTAKPQLHVQPLEAKESRYGDMSLKPHSTTMEKTKRITNSHSATPSGYRFYSSLEIITVDRS